LAPQASSQLKAVIDALNQRTEYTYDPAGNKLTQKDANNHSITYAYDNVNRRTSRTLPLGPTESFTYDAVGNMATRTDFNGKTTSFAYDSLSRLLSRTPDASFSAPAVTFTYTSTGQRASMTDASGTTTYTYNSRNQVAPRPLCKVR
jgi:YD repeat-containing protein